MFLNYAIEQYKKGNVSAGLSADESDTEVYLDAKGLAQFALPFLSDAERLQIGTLSKTDAKHHVMCPNKKRG
jgi:hypothetical protein